MTIQLEEVKFKHKVSEEKIIRLEAELISKEEKIDFYLYATNNFLINFYIICILETKLKI